MARSNDAACSGWCDGSATSAWPRTSHQRARRRAVATGALEQRVDLIERGERGRKLSVPDRVGSTIQQDVGDERMQFTMPRPYQLEFAILQGCVPVRFVEFAIAKLKPTSRWSRVSA
jgi:hypothetical protein